MQTGTLAIMFVVFCLVAGALIKSLALRLRLPYSVLLLLAGLGAGLLARQPQLHDSLPSYPQAIAQLANIEPHMILLLFLPTLIFESAFSLETHLFKRLFNQIALLAVPALLVMTLLTAVLVYYWLPWQWSWLSCLLFGALISATDPVAVVALLKEVSSRKRLETLIEGESLLNDGTAIVLFTLFLTLLGGASNDIQLLGIVVHFAAVVCLGFVVGIAVRAGLLLWIKWLFNQPLLEITLTICAAYLAYYLAEHIFHVSGVVAVVTLGVLLASIGRTYISPQVAEFLHHFWRTMAYIANTLIFVLVGIIIAQRINLELLDSAWVLLWLYLVIMAIRAIAVMMFMPLLGRVGIGINKDKAIVLIWGGLRGAVSLCLALIVAQGDVVDQTLGDQILLLTAGVVVLTIVINSSTMGWVLRYLHLDRLPSAKQATVDRSIYAVKSELKNLAERLKHNEFLQGADWPLIERQLELHQPLREINDINVEQAFKRRLLETERMHYWILFREGALTGTATRHLVDNVERALDGEPNISPRHGLYYHWQQPNWLQWLGRYPRLNHLATQLAFERLAQSYDIARGFILAQEEIARHAHRLAPSRQCKEQVLGEINHNIEQTRERIRLLKETFPHLSYQLETHNARRLMLNLERVGIENQVHEGILDGSEASKLITQIEHQLVQLSRQKGLISPQETAKQLAKAQWAQPINAATLERLAKHAHRQIYGQGEVLYRQHQPCTVIGIIVRGQVALLNTEHEQIAQAGEIIGCSGLLSNHYIESAKALSPLDMIWLDVAKLRQLMDKDHQLNQAIALQVAAHSS